MRKLSFNGWKENTVYQHNRYNPTSRTSGPVNKLSIMQFNATVKGKRKLLLKRVTIKVLQWNEYNSKRNLNVFQLYFHLLGIPKN